jgi:TRAP-type C4-dicarboxylate transport system substrate-binding protein
MTITVANGILTLSFKAPTAKMNTILSNSSAKFYENFPYYDNNDPPQVIPFASLTNEQKLNIIDQHVRKMIIAAARDNIVETQVAAARVSAEQVDQSIT